MAISCYASSPLPLCHPVSSLPLRISYFSARIPIVTTFSTKNNWGIVCCSVTSQLVVASARSSFRKGQGGGHGDAEFCVVTFYKFVSIEDPEREVAKHQEFLQRFDIHGRIYVNEQGINAQLEGGMSHLPVLNPTMRATLLTPAEWRERMQASINTSEPPNKASGSNHDRKSLLLDVRNGYEWDVGHFQGAERPEVDCFRNTSVGLSSDETAAFDLLAGVDKENIDILMYCTGGIRCDVYSTILSQRGFQNLYTLSGGVSNYLKTEGSTGWIGNLFVFDSRLSLPPSTYNSTLTTNARSKIVSESERFARCYICRSQILEFRHRNCANLDCNRLFLSCGNCVEEFSGCCCSDCTQARRLRPVLRGHMRYRKWHIYRDGDF